MNPGIHVLCTPGFGSRDQAGLGTRSCTHEDSARSRTLSVLLLWLLPHVITPTGIPVPTVVDLGSWSRGSGAGGRGRVRRRGVRAAGGNHLGSRGSASADRRDLLRVVDLAHRRDLHVVRSRRGAGSLDHEVHLEVVRNVAGGRVREVVVLSSQRRGASSAEHEVLLRVNRRIRHRGHVDRGSARRDRSSRVVRERLVEARPCNRRGAGHLRDQAVVGGRGNGGLHRDRGRGFVVLLVLQRGRSGSLHRRRSEQSSAGSKDRGEREHRSHGTGSGPKTGRHACSSLHL